jgi:two-component system chemotaxis response regulator CheB
VLSRRQFVVNTSADREIAAHAYAIVAVASSAGGITALQRVLGNLPKDFPLPIVVVQHLDPRHGTIIADVVGRRTKLETVLAVDGERVRPATIHIAPPDRHLLIDADGTLSLSGSAVVHFVRPAADRLFESVAKSYGSAAVACVLTGTGSDGAKGTSAIKAGGGMVIVQDPESAEFDGMPRASIEAGSADLVLPLDEIAGAIRGLVEATAS